MSENDERVSYISNFKGSNAICLITHSEALLWTDGRYYIQAEKELNKSWEMIKIEEENKSIENIIEDIIVKNNKINKKNEKLKIGIDKSLINSSKYSYNFFRKIFEIFW